MNTVDPAQTIAPLRPAARRRGHRTALPLVLLSLVACSGNEGGLEDIQEEPDACQDLDDCVAFALQDGKTATEAKGAFTLADENVVIMQVEDDAITSVAAFPVEPGTQALISVPARSNELIDPNATDQTWGWCTIDGSGNSLAKHHASGDTDQGTVLALPGPRSAEDDAIFYAVRMYGETQDMDGTTLFVGQDPMVVVRALSGKTISPTKDSKQPEAVECCARESQESWTTTSCDCSRGTCTCNNGTVQCS